MTAELELRRRVGGFDGERRGSGELANGLSLARSLRRGERHWSERQELKKRTTTMKLLPPLSLSFDLGGLSSQTSPHSTRDSKITPPGNNNKQTSLFSSRRDSPQSTAALPPRNPPPRARAQEPAAAPPPLPLRPTSPGAAAASPTPTRRCTPSTMSTRSCNLGRKGSKGRGRG